MAAFYFQAALFIEEDVVVPKCIQCGDCCKKFYLGCATNKDIKRWKDNDRFDILNNCDVWQYRKRGPKIYDMFFGGDDIRPNPESACPYYHGPTKKCRINDVKPDICREYYCEKGVLL